MKTTPFMMFFAGVGTVVAALAVGFGGGLFLTHTSVVKETPAISAAKLERLRASKPEVTNVQTAEAAKPSELSASLMTATTQMPVDVKTPAPIVSTVAAAPQVTPPGAQIAPVPTPQIAAVQGQTSFEGPDNAVDVTLGDKPIAEPRKERRSRSSQQRKAREIVAESREGVDAGGQQIVRTYKILRGAPLDRDGYAEHGSQTTRVVTRTYEARSRGFGGLFGDTDED